MKTRHKIMSLLLSGAMVFSLLPASAIGPVQAADSTNYALTATATASGSETSAFGPEKAQDGDATTSTSRWASEKRDASESNPHWLALDFGEVKTVNSVVITWERRNATNYAIETSTDGRSWQAVKTFTSAPTEKEQVINLDAPVETRYIRVRINAFDANSEGVDWATVSIYEFEVYGEKQQSNNEIWDALNNLTVKAGDKKLNLPAVEGGKVEAYADYEQIIDTDGTIYQPLEDKTVSVEFKVTDKNNKVTKKEIAVTVPGIHTAAVNENAKPAVLPELAEWAGSTGDFTVKNSSRIVINPADKDTLSAMAEEFAADYKDIVGKDISVVYRTEKDVKAGDFYFALTDSSKGLKDEGYLSEIGDSIKTESETATGAYWATRTFLQILKQNKTTIPKGTTRDYPKYKVRGVILDVGRKATELQTVKDIAATMSWYKMNDLQVHLNDNLIFLEDYWDTNAETTMQNSFTKAYAAFRLESSVKNGQGETATATDLSYTKDEFRSLIKDSRTIGVNIVPEIDVPAHALAFTKTFQNCALKKMNSSNSKRPLTDHLDLSKPESTKLAKYIFSDYIDGDNPVFDEQTTVHIGADEYEDDATLYRNFVNEMESYMKSKNRKMRMWGGLTRIKSNTEVRGEGVEINVWSKDWADPTEMYNLGFELINCLDSNVYIVPAAGYYKDYLDTANLYANWKPNVFKSGSLNTTIPAGDPQMIGGAYALWNDSIDTRGNGVTDYDVFDRIYQPMSALSEKLWGEGTKTYNEVKATTAKVSTAPNTNPYHEIESAGSTYAEYNFDKEDGKDASRNKYDAVSSKNATYAEGKVGKALSMKNDTCIETPLDKAPAGTSLSFWVKKAAGGSSDEQVLFEGSSTLGDYTIKAVQKNTGKVGYSREGYDYSFEYTLPENEWVHLTIKGYKDKAELYVNDSDTAIPAVMDTATELASQYRLATLNIPIKYIGSTTGNSFNGLIDEVELTNSGSSEAEDETIISSDGFKVSCDNEQNPAQGNDGPISYAFDGNVDTLWHSQYSPSKKALPATFTVDMGKTYNIDKFTYVPRQSGGPNGYITSYDLYIKKAESDDWTQVVTNGTWAFDTIIKTAAFEASEARYIKFVAKAGSNDFATASEFYIHETESSVAAPVRATLAQAVEEAKDLYETGNIAASYTEESWKAFTDAYEAAKAVTDQSTLRELTELLEELKNAKAQLKNAEVEAAKDTLKEAVSDEEVKGIYVEGNAEELYTEESWQAFEEAYEAAKNAEDDATAEELQNLKTKLINAKANLKDMKTAVRGDLAAAVADTETKGIYDTGNHAGIYTDASWVVFKEAYEAAKAPAKDATAKELKVLLDNLKSAKAGLKKAENETKPSEKPSDKPTDKPTETPPAKETEAPQKTNETVSKNVTYRILNAKKKTAAAAGVGGSKGRNVTSVTIAKTVKINGVTYKVTQIDNNAFKGCKKLKKVTIGSNVKKIGKNAFANCSKLKTVNMKKANGITSIGRKAFSKIAAKAKVTVPAKKLAKYSKMLKKAGLPKKAVIKK